MAEVLHQNLAKIEASDIHTRLGLEKGKYILPVSYTHLDVYKRQV